MKPKFTPGENIAVKVPPHEFDQTVLFYKTILGLEQIGRSSSESIESVTFKFGCKKLWVDKVSGISQAEIWLEVMTDNIEAASKYFEKTRCIRRDEIEPLPKGFSGFWISSPSNIIHLITDENT